jgi:hypothetical protein
MASSGDSGLSSDKHVPPEQNPTPKPTAGDNDEARPKVHPETSCESEGTPSVDDTMSRGGDVSKFDHRFILATCSRDTGG